MTRRAIALILAFAPLLLAMAPSPSTARSERRLALKGYDPVAYFTEGKPTQGKPEFETVFDRTRYRFASAANMARFKADPDKFAPQFAGFCTGAMSRGMKVEANPEIWRIIDGKLYVFAGTRAFDAVQAEPAELIDAAREHWKTAEKTQ